MDRSASILPPFLYLIDAMFHLLDHTNLGRRASVPMGGSMGERSQSIKVNVFRSSASWLHFDDCARRQKTLGIYYLWEILDIANVVCPLAGRTSILFWYQPCDLD